MLKRQLTVIHAQGFNLNLLECKITNNISSVAFCMRFNLNLLECKTWSALHSKSSQKVLISTYWNVKSFLLLIIFVQLFRFNLNLLECKNVKTYAFQICSICFNLNLLECKMLAVRLLNN